MILYSRTCNKESEEIQRITFDFVEAAPGEGDTEWLV